MTSRLVMLLNALVLSVCVRTMPALAQSPVDQFCGDLKRVLAEVRDGFPSFVLELSHEVGTSDSTKELIFKATPIADFETAFVVKIEHRRLDYQVSTSFIYHAHSMIRFRSFSGDPVGDLKKWIARCLDQPIAPGETRVTAFRVGNAQVCVTVRPLRSLDTGLSVMVRDLTLGPAHDYRC